MFSRKREINIMKYIGATNWFIRWPFIFEGIIIGMTTEENKKYDVKDEINAALSAGNGPKIARFALAAVGGAIPYAGGLIGAVGSTWSENEQSNLNKLFNIWLKLMVQ